MYRAPAWGSLSHDTMTLAPGASRSITVRAQDVDYAGHRVDWSARPDAPLSLSADGGRIQVDGPGFRTTTVVVAADRDAEPGAYEIPFGFVVGDDEVGTARLRVLVAR